MVVLPLFPIAGGNADPERGSASVNCLMHQQFTTISRGGHSLLELLRADGIDTGRYVRFFGLRTYGEQSFGLPVPLFDTEQVYVHSKLMIVDGTAALLGSANLNDRSLLGDRDSEINVLVRDADDDTNGFSATLQAQLLAEHLGLARASADEAADILVDPASEQAWAAICNVAAVNTSAFDAAFGCVPADYVETFSQLERLRQRREVGRALASAHSHGLSMASTGVSRRSFGSGTAPPPTPGSLASGHSSTARQGSADALAAGGGAAPPIAAVSEALRSLSLALPGARARGMFESRDSLSEQSGPADGQEGAADGAGGLPPAFYDKRQHSPPPPLEVNLAALQHVQGHLVELPLRFLERERLQPENPNAITRELIETLQ
ncbi:hypothetical protein T492DRAFT_387035 [Pavlovales sp. CCMP2436]|nr:hypothetical protein T492DRAFT_387035 [Pavlovales sp. CCMP2436]